MKKALYLMLCLTLAVMIAFGAAGTVCLADDVNWDEWEDDDWDNGDWEEDWDFADEGNPIDGNTVFTSLPKGVIISDAFDMYGDYMYFTFVNEQGEQIGNATLSPAGSVGPLSADGTFTTAEGWFITDSLDFGEYYYVMAVNSAYSVSLIFNGDIDFSFLSVLLYGIR